VHNREVQNSCTFFEFRPAPASSASGAKKTDPSEVNSEAERAKEAFRALFRTP
jgi:hypothetical protein